MTTLRKLYENLMTTLWRIKGVHLIKSEVVKRWVGEWCIGGELNWPIQNVNKYHDIVWLTVIKFSTYYNQISRSA